MTESSQTPALTRLVAMFLRGDVAILLIAVSLMVGVAALYLTPREEEPQIVVPMADVMISAPGLSAREVEQQVTAPLEKLLFQIDGVEYVTSMSRPEQSIVTVRFYVGEDREDSLVKLYNKINSNTDAVPPSVSAWVVKPIEIDDVPIVNVTLWSRDDQRYGDYELRRLAEQIQYELQAIRDTNRVTVIGGRPRRVRVELDPIRLASRATSALQVAQALRASNVSLRAGSFQQQNEEFPLEAGVFVADVYELRRLVVNVAGERPVYLEDVADVIDGPAEVENYSWIGFGRARQTEDDNTRDALPSPPTAASFSGATSIWGRGAGGEGVAGRRRSDVQLAPPHPDPLPRDIIALDSESNRGGEGDRFSTNSRAADAFPHAVFPAVHIAVGKQKGRNAVWVAEEVDRRMAELARTHLPDGVEYRITRDYGETADHKVNELVESLAVAVLTVIGLIGFTLGWRAALVVALAVPVCYSLTLFVNLLAGYTINRVTMFALILALGLLVDDPITDVENIARYFSTTRIPRREATLQAIQEVRPALILSTLAIIASFLPLAFITGMMGPYMAPMALNVPLTVTMSTVVAFLITPWLAMVSIGRGGDSDTEFDITTRPLYRASRVILGPILDRRWLCWGVLGGVAVLLFGALLPAAFREVPLKMLPYDNKNEFQVVIDMPEGTTLDRTNAVAMEVGNYLAGLSEVRDYEVYVGTASPMDFNGMVRHYFLRDAPQLADIRVNLLDKEHRVQQSHEIILRIRRDVQQLADRFGANIKLVEVPPGPPVVSTITAEVYGPSEASYRGIQQAAALVEQRLAREPGVVDVDSSLEAEQTRWVFVTDKAKASLSGISTDDVARTLELALHGLPASVLHAPDEVNPLWIELRIPRQERSAIDDLEEMYVQGGAGQMVQLGAIGRFVEQPEDQTIYHKNLHRVAYVYGEVAGRAPADAILDMEWDRQQMAPLRVAPQRDTDDGTEEARPVESRTWWRPGGGDGWGVPEGYRIEWAGEGEWKITLDVFRDLGLAFAAALFAIFVILMFQTGSRMLPIVIMLAIPLTLIGIMPGFWLLNVLVNRPVGGFENPVFFTATAMIGMIALAGIVVRNSVVLIDFIQMAVREGLDLREATIRSVAIRTRPILLTAGTTLLGNWVITLDPIFSGLAWAIIFGILTSTLFTLIVIPVVYWLLYAKTSVEHAAQSSAG